MAEPEPSQVAHSGMSTHPAQPSPAPHWDLAKLTVDHFLPLIGQPFDIQPAASPASQAPSAPWTLVDASPLPIPARPLPIPRVPFSLIFASENRQPVRQGIRKISHPEFGSAELFLVPVESHSAHLHLEAIFY